jgi:hypothetical protein
MRCECSAKHLTPCIKAQCYDPRPVDEAAQTRARRRRDVGAGDLRCVPGRGLRHQGDGRRLVLERIANRVRFDAQASGYCQVCEQTTGPVSWMPRRG